MQTDTFVTPGLVEEFTFPDGQPHLKMLQFPENVTVRIRNPVDLFKVMQMIWIYDGRPLNLRILYLMAGRMDRALSENEPATLHDVTSLLNIALWRWNGHCGVGVFCQHSAVTANRLAIPFEPDPSEDSFFDTGILNCILGYDSSLIKGGRYETRNVTHSLVYPDKGACDRFASGYKFPSWHQTAEPVVLSKKRELATGKILGMEIVSGTPGECCIIVDDLCDGGATFIGAAKCLREAGAKFVGLVVAHGIFSKGLDVLFDNGIDHIHTSNSFKDWKAAPKPTVTQLL